MSQWLNLWWTDLFKVSYTTIVSVYSPSPYKQLILKFSSIMSSYERDREKKTKREKNHSSASCFLSGWRKKNSWHPFPGLEKRLICTNEQVLSPPPAAPLLLVPPRVIVGNADVTSDSGLSQYGSAVGCITMSTVLLLRPGLWPRLTSLTY